MKICERLLHAARRLHLEVEEVSSLQLFFGILDEGAGGQSLWDWLMEQRDLGDERFRFCMTRSPGAIYELAGLGRPDLVGRGTRARTSSRDFIGQSPEAPNFQEKKPRTSRTSHHPCV